MPLPLPTRRRQLSVLAQTQGLYSHGQRPSTHSNSLELARRQAGALMKTHLCTKCSLFLSLSLSIRLSLSLSLSLSLNLSLSLSKSLSKSPNLFNSLSLNL
ncbi:uncharacterized protein MONBRDRAFT_24087 [Monosiga brevicollis MX1]|uniref:Uncharacterized protein n=1 Tax=Monosiga brevicollis TaxID=81824 RepID=A9UUN9_MONBE|nr:uncharacterized protein MONBRDRAFT_24087 [Monosiga brevicollis MX1]EDQ91132.1 predicted protein [Monosiga brevicollis MX1]|eukprot:XP_001744429.1 hypothetical protein [Monosiga brevicollis MX1]